jgi:molybdopterin-guanine dinucleotide biosynthesis protein A
MQIMIAILAGGESRRMGRDKAEIVIAGETMLARTARIALEACPQVIVAGRESAPPGWPQDGVSFIGDDIPGEGPMAGLETALRHGGAERAVLLLACDMPRLAADALRWLIEAADACEMLGDGLVTLSGAQREPLFSIYSASCLPLIARQRQTGRRSLQSLIDAGRFATVAAPPEIAARLVNVNTPGDLAALGGLLFLTPA